ncbi:MAG: transcriptional regulator [Chloroflexota bacterium]|nr:MAG: transcriptional regulator [Chloroflexota bacterium]
MTSPAVQNYLKAIYTLQENQASVTTSALAASLGVSAASATNMMKKLARAKLARRAPYRGVQLTPRGEKMALEVIRHHRLVELFLTRALGIPWESVHAEAEKIEHVISEDLEDRIAAFLGNPTRDPHGDPIPTQDGRVERLALVSLLELAPGQTATVQRVSDHNPAHLRLLTRLGLTLDARVTVIKREPANGPLRVRVAANTERALDEKLAREIWVAPTPPRPTRRANKNKV